MSDYILDDVDRGIITLLEKDARMPYTEVAKKLKVSDATIHVRVKKMEEAGIIKKYTIVVDQEKVGKPFTAYVLINVTPGKLENVAKKLIEDTTELHEIHGQYDLLLKLYGESLSALRDKVTNVVRKTPGVTSTEVLTVFKTWKKDFTIY